jgi:thiamine-phosphate pyrophosphorylase
MGRRPRLDLSLYLVTDTAMCQELGVAATVSAAVGAGVSAVQLRDVDATDDELVCLGLEVLEALRGTGVPLIINDRVDLVAAIGAQGAHVGQGDLDVNRAREMLGPDAYLGLSAQTVEHVAAARALDVDTLDGGTLDAGTIDAGTIDAGTIDAGTIDYLGVGPVWGTTSKLDAATPGGVERLARIVSASPWPCVAIGGITVERLAEVRKAGAAGAAVVSAICGQPDVAAATRELRSAWDAAAGPLSTPGGPGARPRGAVSRGASR